MDQHIGDNMPDALLQRPRLNMLFSQGILHPLIMVIAGTGYGKTIAVWQFAERTGERVIWYSANNINNYTERFWRTLRDTIGKQLPSLAQRLKDLPFPRTYKEQDYFLRIFAEAVYGGKHVLFVVDNVQDIVNEEIKQFFYALLEAGLENFCMVAISNAKYHSYFRPKMPHGAPFHITAEDLGYTDDEMRQRLEISGIDTSDAIIATAQKVTDGWPLAVQVLVSHWQDRRNLFTQTPFSIEQFLGLFYRDYYTRYGVDVQQLLIKLSYLPMFSLEIISEIGGCDLHEAINVLQTNPFIHSDHANATYTFQVVYKHFLSKYFIIEEEECRRVCRIAAAYAAQNGFAQEGAELYARAGAYDEAFAALNAHPYERMDQDTTAAFAACLDSFSPDYMAAHPLVRIYHALIQLLMGKRQDAEIALRSMLPHYEDVPEIAGEIYLSLAEIIADRNLHEAIPYFAKASECLPSGSALRMSDAHYFVNKSMIKLPDTSAGSLERHMEGLQEIVLHISMVYRRVSGSWYDLTCAEAAYYQLDVEAARKQAHKAVYKAAMDGQHDIQCNAWFLLLRIEMMYGNLEKAEEYSDKINALILERELSTLFILQDCIAGWFHLKLRDFRGFPKWLMDGSGDEITKLFPSSERDIILRVMYKVEIGEYDEAMAMIVAYRPYCEEHMFWTVRLYLHIQEAIVHTKYGDTQAALRAFQEAYTLTYANNIVAPFIETGYPLRSVIGMVRKMDHGLDGAWLDTLYAKTSTYAKRMNNMAREYAKKRTTAVADRTHLSLSEREITVLEYLTQGLKYEEISDSMGISINGVKKHVTSIYSKLGAINRADAIYIAMREGIIT